MAANIIVLGLYSLRGAYLMKEHYALAPLGSIETK
jgi:hypothetical protein